MRKYILAAALAAVLMAVCADAQRTHFQLFRGDEAAMPSLVAGEPGFALDTHRLFVGDGTTNYAFWPKVALDSVYAPINTVELKITALNTAPASATATGTVGEIRVTATAIYVCVATNTWVKTALASW